MARPRRFRQTSLWLWCDPHPNNNLMDADRNVLYVVDVLWEGPERVTPSGSVHTTA